MKAEVIGGAVGGPPRIMLLAGSEGRGLERLIAGHEKLTVACRVDDHSLAVSKFRETQPNAVLVCLPVPIGASVIGALTGEYPGARIVVFAAAGEPEYDMLARQSGAAVYLARPFTADQLLVTLRRLASLPPPPPPVDQVDQVEEVGPLASVEPVHQTASTPAESIIPLLADSPTGKTATVTMVLGGKGGVGKTTIAIGLAAALSRIAPGRVALVDLDLQFGDVALMLGVQPDRGMADVSALFTDDGSVNSITIGSFMPEFRNLRLLTAPPAPEQADTIAPEHVRAAIEGIMPAFDHVVIDGSAHFGDEVLEAVDFADHVLLVSDLTVGAIKETILCMKLLPLLGVPEEKLQLVLNRVGGPGSHTPEQVERHLERRAAAFIPNDDEQAMEAVRKNLPIIDAVPGSDLSRAIVELAAQLAGQPIKLVEEPRQSSRRTLGLPLMRRRVLV